MAKPKFEVFIWIKVFAVEVASTVVFVFIVCWAVFWEIRHLLGR